MTAQAYDCAVMLSLATATVDAGDADDLAQAMIDVTGDGVTCTTYEDCLEKLNAGDNINYDGVSGKIQLDENGDPTFARFTTASLEGGVVADIESTDVNIADIRRQQEAYASAAFYTQLQLALQYLGFYTGPINGINTAETQAALAAFQTSVGLPATGVWDEATAAALATALGENAAQLTQATRDIQLLMTDLGYYSGPIDGIWNQELTDAIKTLQRDLGVPETGVLDAATLQAIYAQGVLTGSTTTTTAPPATTAPATTAPATTVPPTAPPTTVPPPAELPTLGEVLSAREYSDYLSLLIAAGFEEDFSQLAKYTVFAPTNDAFTAAGYNVAAILADVEADPDKVAELNLVLLNTIALGSLNVGDLSNPQLMLSGEELAVVNDGVNPVTIGGATITGAPVPASNGIVHQLGQLPPRPQPR
jgi:peptidoglycan hydrolase-like protein with peptidoglycan-binding domain